MSGSDLFEQLSGKGLETMNARRGLGSLVLLALGFGFLLIAQPRAESAEETPNVSSTEVVATDEGFTPLFNGTNLDGWAEVQGLPGTFKVENGVIVGMHTKVDGKKTAYWLSSTERYRNFVLRLQYKLEKDGNAGVFIHVPDYKGRTSVVGMEIQLRDDGAEDKPADASNTGAIYRVVAPKGRFAPPAHQWNDLQITCTGERIQVEINGKLFNDVKVADVPELVKRPQEGYIGLSAHTDHVYYRNIRIKRLPE